MELRKMKDLPIKRILTDETRMQGVLIGGEVYSLHIKGDEVIITDHTDYTKIYSIQSLGMYQRIEIDDMYG